MTSMAGQNSNVTETDGVIKKESFRSYGTSSFVNKQELDLIESTIGSFGAWQCRTSFLLSLLKFPMAWIQLSIVFLAPPTEFWCKGPEPFLNLSLSDFAKIIAIFNNTLNETHGEKSNICNKTMPCPWGYEYNRSQFGSSIITEWNLVCNRSHLVELTQVALMFGVLLGSICIGLLADKFGRRTILLVSILVQTTLGFVLAIVPWFGLFTIIRFFLGFVNGGVMVVSFVICMEIVGGKWRTIVPILYQIPFGIGNSIMALIAYFLRHWRDLQFSLSALSAFFVIYICLIPESPRWLFISGQTEETIKLLEKAAEINKVDKTQIRSIVETLSNNKSFLKQNFGICALFKTPELKKRSILMCIDSFIAGISFYGFSQYLTEISPNIYFAAFFGGLIIIPGGFLCILAITRCGRRLSIAAANVFIAFCFFGICLIPTGLYPYDWPRILLATNGVLGMAVAYPALYLYISELYPTVLRNSGVGITVMFTRLGSMLAPILLTTSKITPYLPLAICGFMSLVQATLMIKLPETLNASLPDDVNDIEQTNIRTPSESSGSETRGKIEDTRE